ncbi:MAG: ABC transporter permease [Anaerotignaceae bacterium]
MRKKVILIIFSILIATLIFIPTQSITKVDMSHTLESASLAHLMGTDNLGKDVFALFANGCKRTLLVVFTATIISVVVGAPLGLMGGYVGGIFEIIIQFIADFSLVIPSFIVALIFSSIFGFSPINAGIVLGLMGTGEYINQMLILTKTIKNEDFITSEVIAGISNFKIIFYHILPNVKNALLTFMANRASGVVLSYAGLAYIGLGTDLTNPDWGTMIYQYRLYIVTNPSLVLFPTLGIFGLSLFFHLMFDNTTL